jgi:hypothetical protein
MNLAKLAHALAGVLLAVLLAAACADPGTGDAGAGGGQGAATTVPTTPPGSGTGQAPPAGKLRVTGTVTRGVEGNCLLLEAGGGPYLLVGGDREALRPGARVAVTGTVDRDLLSTCQQGVPLVVASVDASP